MPRIGDQVHKGPIIGTIVSISKNIYTILTRDGRREHWSPNTFEKLTPFEQSTLYFKPVDIVQPTRRMPLREPEPKIVPISKPKPEPPKEPIVVVEPATPKSTELKQLPNKWWHWIVRYPWGETYMQGNKKKMEDAEYEIDLASDLIIKELDQQLKELEESETANKKGDTDTP